MLVLSFSPRSLTPAPKPAQPSPKLYLYPFRLGRRLWVSPQKRAHHSVKFSPPSHPIFLGVPLFVSFRCVSSSLRTPSLPSFSKRRRHRFRDSDQRSGTNCSSLETAKDYAGVGWGLAQMLLTKWAPNAVDSNPVRITFGLAKWSFHLKTFVGNSFRQFVTDLSHRGWMTIRIQSSNEYCRPSRGAEFSGGVGSNAEELREMREYKRYCTPFHFGRTLTSRNCLGPSLKNWRS